MTQATHPYRRLPLEGAANVRDLGGYPTADGGVTRYGVFIRSGAPDDCTERDLEALRALGVTTNVDLRGAGEAESAGGGLGRGRGGFTYRNIPVFDPRTGGGDNNEPYSLPLGDLYLYILDDRPGFFRDVYAALLEAEGATLFNCFAGKDRTGIIAASLLAVAGVGRLDIIADYSVSATYLTEVFEKYDDLPEERRDYHMSYPETMARLLDHAETKWGGLPGRLLEAGVPQATLDALRRRFVSHG